MPTSTLSRSRMLTLVTISHFSGHTVRFGGKSWADGNTDSRFHWPHQPKTGTCFNLNPASGMGLRKHLQSLMNDVSLITQIVDISNKKGSSPMSEVFKAIKFWHCDNCGFEWKAGQIKPRQCRQCGTRSWNCGAAIGLRPARILKPTSYPNARFAK
jgi:NAD-dependent SIR2 family protein deacetylase